MKVEGNLTADEIRAGLPKKVHEYVTEGFVDLLNAAQQGNEIYLEQFRRNFFTYTDVIAEGRYSLQEYMDAVQFVTLVLFGRSDIDAYKGAFPERYAALRARGVTDSEVSSYVNSVKRTKIVASLLERSLVAPYVIYQNVYHQAIAMSLDIAKNARNENAKVKALELLLNQLKVPDTIKAKLEINVKQDKDMMSDLRKITEALALEQQKAIMLKTNSVEEIAHLNILPEYVEVESE